MNYGLGGMIEQAESYIINHIKCSSTNSKPVIFDVGANHGQYLSNLLNAFKDNCTIYSYEPSKNCIKTLERLQDKNVSIFNLALSSKIGEMQLNFEHKGSVFTSVYPQDVEYGNNVFNNTEKIEATTLDEFCKQKHVDLIDFLKIDVEGH